MNKRILSLSKSHRLFQRTTKSWRALTLSPDGGLTWVYTQDVGVQHGAQNTVFPTTAVDSDRAAHFFLCSTTPGATGRGTDKTFPGTWYGFNSTTYVGGQTWVTVNAAPGDPVQRGVIC